MLENTRLYLDCACMGAARMNASNSGWECVPTSFAVTLFAPGQYAHQSSLVIMLLWSMYSIFATVAVTSVLWVLLPGSSDHRLSAADPGLRVEPLRAGAMATRSEDSV